MLYVLVNLPASCDPSLFLVSELGPQCVWVYACHTCVRRQLCGVTSALLPFYRIQRLNSGHQVCMANLEPWLTSEILCSQRLSWTFDYFHLSNGGSTDACHLPVHAVPGPWTQGFMRVRQSFYQGSYSSRPSLALLMFFFHWKPLVLQDALLPSAGWCFKAKTHIYGNTPVDAGWPYTMCSPLSWEQLTSM